jgi:signal transduction histidine kinase
MTICDTLVLVRTLLAEGLPPVQGDRVQLQQVLLNLIINAIGAMCGVREGERQLFVSTGNESEGVLVEVQDTGPGLTPATLDHLFGAFYTTKPGGAGIVDLPINHPSAQWTLMGQSERSTWRHFHFIAPAHPGGAS